MSEVIGYKDVEEKVLIIREQSVILDKDVAALYGVTTREVNQAVRNNPDKFPEGYIIYMTLEEWKILKSKYLTSSWGGKNKPPKAFTEKGLYMLATILKSTKAVQTTIAIVETFAKMRELSKTISQLPELQEESRKKTLMQKSGELLADIFDNDMLEVSGDETSIEINLAVMKIKHTIKRDKTRN